MAEEDPVVEPEEEEDDATPGSQEVEEVDEEIAFFQKLDKLLEGETTLEKARPPRAARAAARAARAPARPRARARARAIYVG